STAIAAVAPFAAMRAQTPAQQTTLAAARPEPETAAALLHLRRSTISSGLRTWRYGRIIDDLAGHDQAATGSRSARRRIALSGRAGRGGEIRKTHVAQLSPKRQTNAEASRIGAGVGPQLLFKLQPA